MIVGCSGILSFFQIRVSWPLFYVNCVGSFRLADEVKQWKQKMSKWKVKVAERLQILEKRARGESIDPVHYHFSVLFVKLGFSGINAVFDQFERFFE